ncbi:MAG TPA: ribonuclease E/G [Candidatus Mediterraneibacter norfolkensis]|nr:ribonuclease E/G [Candidatus Mediterraneibacter norfolkensis]
MKRKILIEKTEGQVRTFLLENDTVVEIHCADSGEKGQGRYQIGDIYIGKVKNIVRNIGAAFIEIESGVNCYYDIKDAENAVFTTKIGKKPLCIGDELVVQVSKEAVKTKAPTVTSNISLTGRYAVVTHGNTRIGVSSKLPKKMREEYKEQLQKYQNERFGIIVRTNAKDVCAREVEEEIEKLRSEYERIVETAPTRTCFSCLKSAPPSYIANLKNVYTEGLEEIVVGDSVLYTSIQSYFASEFPKKTGLLRLCDDPDFPLGKRYSTETILEKALREKVWLKNGGYLVIQPTEALTVIDVNSGKSIGKEKDEAGIMKINLEAAREAAHQIRLRNLSGIIIVDFINLEKKENVSLLLKEFRGFLSRDPIQTTLVDITPLNLVEVTRKKVRKPLYETVQRRYNSEPRVSDDRVPM